MAPPKAASSSQGKTQRTISSFFTPKQPASSDTTFTGIPAPKTRIPTISRNTIKESETPSIDAGENRNGADLIDTARESAAKENEDDFSKAPTRRSGQTLGSNFKKRSLESEDDHHHSKIGGDDDDRNSGNGNGKNSRRRKKLRRIPSFQPSEDDATERDDKENEDEEMEDFNPNVSMMSKLKGLSVSGTSKQSLKEITREKSSRFAYTTSQTLSAPSTSEADPEYAKQKAKLREKFIQKLGRPGSIDEISRRKKGADGDDAEEGGDGEYAEEEMEEEEEVPKPKGGKKGAAKATAGKKGKSKLTPLEKQVVDIKMEYPDTVLVVEVGYKFRFFGEDARVRHHSLAALIWNDEVNEYLFENFR